MDNRLRSLQKINWTPSKLVDRLGKEINNPESVYYWCHKVSNTDNRYYKDSVKFGSSNLIQSKSRENSSLRSQQFLQNYLNFPIINLFRIKFLYSALL